MSAALDLSPAKRRERGTRLCRRLSAEVRKIAPQGIHRWQPAWTITSPSDAAFIEALTAWEADPGSDTLERVRKGYEAVVRAWQVAAEEYLAGGYS